MRYIDADKLMLHLNDYKLQVSPSWKDKWERMVSCLVIDTCMEAVQEQPTADVRENVKAHWIDMKPTGDSRFMCSRCKVKEKVPTIMGEPIVWDYCPNCGAEMRKGGAE